MRTSGVVVAAVVVLLLTGCSQSGPASGPAITDTTPPSASSSPPAEESGDPLPSAPPTQAPAPTGPLVLLPRSCTKADGVHVVSAAADGATGHYLNRWRIESRTPCTLAGRPAVALFEADGRRAVIHRTKYFAGGGPAHPVAIGPGKSARVAISTFRCDVTRDPPSLTTARIDFAPNGFHQESDAVVTARLKLPTPYCPKEYPEDVGVAAIGSQDHRSTRPYAVNMHSSFDPGKHPTWGRADIDGDGRPDTVILGATSFQRGRPFAQMTVHLSSDALGSKGHIAYVHVGLVSGMRLQALTDLNGDGRSEILIAYPSDPAGPGYYNGVTPSVVYSLVGDRMSGVSGAKPFSLMFAERGEQVSGVVCQGDEVTQVAINGDYQPTRIVRTTYRIKGRYALPVHTTTTTSTADAWDLRHLIENNCPGMGADGWAAGD